MAVAPKEIYNLMALDLGDKYIGVAMTSSVAKLPSPLTTIKVTDSVIDDLLELISQNSVSVLVVGLPRSLSGQDTEQTTKTRQFVSRLKTDSTVKVVFQDEALTSVKAEAELNKRQVSNLKTHVDSLSAVYILEDYINENL